MSTVTITSGSGSWPVPVGVTSVTVQLWGAGGTGAYGDGNPNANGGAGGGGGAYGAVNYSVSYGDTIDYSIGSHTSSNGGNTTVNVSHLNSFNIITAYGGHGGSLSGIGGSWSDPSSLGYNGTNGSNGSAGLLNGTYGSAPGGTGGAGGAAGGTSYGGGTGGAGGAGLADFVGTPGVGSAGHAYGGGGGGGGSGGAVGAAPGNGADGAIIISYSIIHNEVGSGGIKSGGSSVFVKRNNLVATGGIKSSGLSSNYKKINIIASGGIRSSAFSVQVTSSKIVIASGGIKSGGLSVQKSVTKYIPSGGIKSGGNSKNNYNIKLISFGGIIAGGKGIRGTSAVGLGGIKSGGISLSKLGIYARGGMIAGGTGPEVFYDYEIATGGAKVVGHSVSSQNRFYKYKATRGITTSGSADSVIKNRKYTSNAIVQIGGVSSVNMKFHLDMKFLWNINHRIVVDNSFLWNTGQLINYWYRIIGKDKCNHDPCCQRYILNVHARSLSELCGKLIKRRYKFYIESAQQFIMPADNAEVALLESQGRNFDCNPWIPVPLCEIPLCEEFCVNFDLYVDSVSDIAYVQVNADHHYLARGAAYITGSAKVHYSKILPNYSYMTSGGITMSGVATTTSSGFNCIANGGITVGGTPHIRSTSWHFVAGKWPSTSRVQYGQQTESLMDLPTDQVWSLTERIIVSDGLYSSTDISYGKTSQFLILRGFDFSLPENANVLHVYVNVQRKANQLGVRDVEAYIVNGDDIISENKAATSVDWPYMMESQTTYDFTDQFLISDINSFDIGFALRVAATTSVAPTIAYVDEITLEVVYEDSVGQKVRIGGSAGVVSTSYSWVGSGKTTISGSAVAKLGMKYVASKNIGIQISGNYGLNFAYNSDGGTTVSGSALARPSFQQINGSGGSKTGGYAIAKPFFDFGYGGAVAGGSSANNARYNLRTSGGCHVRGKSKIIADSFSVVANGGITMGGDAGRKTEAWVCIPSGGLVIFGGAYYRTSDFGEFYQDSVFDMTVDSMLVEFDADKDLHNAVGINDYLSRCGCGVIPLKLNLEHGLAVDNNFAQFLVRNSLTISTRLTMQYNSLNDSWQTNLYYKGLSADANTQESWSIVFDVQCTQNFGGIFIGKQIWKVGVEIVRKNLNYNTSSSTRILVGVLPDQICAANELNFKAIIDTQTGITEVSPASTVYQSVIYDNIGMFKNQAWIALPNLSITVSQVGLDVIQSRIDLTSDVVLQ